MLAGVILAGVLALGLALKAVVVAIAATVPKASASSVGGVEVVLDAVVIAGARLLGQAAGLLRWLLDILASTELLVRRLGDSIGTATELALHTRAAIAVGALGRGLLVVAALELRLSAVASVVVRSLGEGEPIWTASELGGLARAALVLGSLGGSDLVGTAAILGRLAGASLLVVASCGRLIVRAAAIRSVVAFAALVVGSTRGQDVVGAAAKLSVQAAALLVGTMGRGLGVRTTSKALTCASRATFAIRTACRCLSIRTATVLRLCAALGNR